MSISINSISLTLNSFVICPLFTGSFPCCPVEILHKFGEINIFSSTCDKYFFIVLILFIVFISMTFLRDGSLYFFVSQKESLAELVAIR